MILQRKRRLLLSLCCAFVLFLASSPEGWAAATKPTIMTSFYPIAFFAEAIGGEHVSVVCPCPEDEDAIFWMPDRKTIERFHRADLILLNGAEFEKWADRVALPDSKVVRSTDGAVKDLIRFEKAVEHSHGPAGKHSHAGIDGHTWVDPVNALAQAQTIHQAMVRAFPDKKDAFPTGMENLQKALEGLHQSFQALDISRKKLPLVCSHPAYNYAARRYGWNIKNFHLDPNVLLTAQQLESIKAHLAETPAKYLLWEAQPEPDVEDQVKNELGLLSVEFSPCELLPESDQKAGKTYLTVMEENLKRLQTITESPE